MNENKNHINYTAADIRRYVQGELSPQEMHAMEKAALEDPFLADAIEGMQEAMQAHGEPAVTAQLQQLRDQLQTRTSKSRPARVVAFRWWQAAAAAVIVIAGALWIYNFSTTKNVVTVAKRQEAPGTAAAQTKQPVAADSAPVASYADTKAVAPVPPPQQPKARTGQKQANRAATAPAPRERDAAQPMAATIDSTRAKQIDGALAYSSEKSKLYDRQAFARQAPAARQESLSVSQPAVAAAKKSNDFNNRETELITIVKNDSPAKPAVVDNKNLSGFVKGRVTDPFHNPVANARVTLPNNASYHMLTDKSGYFKLPANDTAVDVAVNVMGYGTQNFRLQNNAGLNELQLQPANASLDEVVVTGYGARRKKNAVNTNYPKVMMQDAEPVYGWLAYEQYLEKNKQRPAGAPDRKGNVVVSFTVNKKGELSHFKIEQSLAKAYDDEAIRLISQGPAWKLVKGRKAKVTVIVKF